MGLSARETMCGRSLLRLLATADLLSLAGTVTKKKSTACTKEGAIDAIIQNSMSAYELLNRRKVLREIIVSHLNGEGVPVPSNITKDEAVQKALAHWSGPDSCTPSAGSFIPSLLMHQQKAAAFDFSHPLYIHTSKLSTWSPQEDASKTWNPGALRPDLGEVFTSMSFQRRDPAPSPPIPNQEAISDSRVSVQQQQKAAFDDSSCPLSLDFSIMSIRNCLKEDGKEQRSIPQPHDLQYDISHRVPSSKGFTCPPQVTKEAKRGYTVTDGDIGKLQKSQAPLVSGTALHLPTRSTLQTVPHMATNTEVQRVPHVTTHSTVQSVLHTKNHSMLKTKPHIVTQSMVQTVPHVTTHSKVQSVLHMKTHSTLQIEPHMSTQSMVQSELHTKTHYTLKTEPHMTTRSTMQTASHTANSSTLQTVPNMTTPPMLQTVRQLAKFGAKTEKVSSTPCTGIMEEEDASCIWPVDCEKFTCDFCKWFFTLLNSQHQSSEVQKKDWGPQHFLENAELQLTYMSARRKYNGGRSASSRLLELVQEDKLTFSPNITSNGIKCERSLKGLVMMVCGTVFRNKSYLGTFDQVTEVVGNCKTNTWKIQYANLKIQNSS